jgi:radical SAM superfamily enzyme YgiQ (UPF0313 family)
MEPLAPATLAGLTPRDKDTEIRFYDDRTEVIPFDEPTDLVALSVETYTAKRSYQIASEYRRRGVPVVMGGFHPTLVPEEASEYAESIVVGEAEELWLTVLDDFRNGRLKRMYRQAQRPSLRGLRPDRSIFAGKNYLPVGLVDAGRGCHFKCEFCAIQTAFGRTQTRRPTEEILDEVRQIAKPLIFFVDDNITSNMNVAKEFFRALIPLKIRWVSQASINAAHDEEFLQIIKASGCQGLLIGFETLEPQNLARMGKTFNLMKGGFEKALENLRHHGIRLYAAFIVGYDEDNGDTVAKTLAFAQRHKFFIAAFNHLTPFPGTPLYDRLKHEGRLLYDRWWLDSQFRYGMVPFSPKGMTADQVKDRCVTARRSFYSIPSILRRGIDFKVNTSGPFWMAQFFSINLLFRHEILNRINFPLGDEAYDAPLLKTEHAPVREPAPVNVN